MRWSSFEAEWEEVITRTELIRVLRKEVELCRGIQKNEEVEGRMSGHYWKVQQSYLLQIKSICDDFGVTEEVFKELLW